MTSPISGSYILILQFNEPFSAVIGALGRYSFNPGNYAYIGSAKRGIASRIARHIRLASEKSGKTHWHIDYLLIRPEVLLSAALPYPGQAECELARFIADHPASSTPVPRFGASDCRNHCPAHFFKIDESGAIISELSRHFNHNPRK